MASPLRTPLPSASTPVTNTTTASSALLASPIASSSMTDSTNVNNQVELPSADHQHGTVDLLTLTIRIETGTAPNTMCYDFHRDLLSYYSGQIKPAIKNIENGRFGESSDGILRWPDEDPVIVTHFRNWLYSADHKLTGGAASIEEDTTIGFRPLVELWCFADRRDIPLLMNRAMDVILTKMGKGKGQDLSLNLIKQMYTQAPAGSKLQLLAVWYSATSATFINCRIAPPLQHAALPSLKDQEWFTDFAKDVVLVRLTKPPFPNTFGPKYRFDRCELHRHPKGVVCKKIWPWS